jgi:hypothetical protein
MNNEMRPEKSLKDLGPVLNAYMYQGHTAKNYTWETPTSEDEDGRTVSDYNAEDTVNSITLASHLARKTIQEWEDTTKLCPFSLQFHNDVLWQVIQMQEHGAPMNRTGLLALEDKLETRNAKIATALSQLQITTTINRKKTRTKDKVKYDEHFTEDITGLHLTNQFLPKGGCTYTQQYLINLCIEEIDNASSNQQSIMDDPLLELTEKKKDIAFSDLNRFLFKSHLPPDSHLRDILEQVDEFTTNEKLIGTYTYPLLHGKRKHVLNGSLNPDRSSVLLPLKQKDCKEWFSSKSSVLSSSSGASPESTSTERTKPCGKTLSLSQPSQPASVYMPLPVGTSTKCSTITVGIAPTSWFTVPSQFSDRSALEGGQLQARVSAKDPAIQTFPPVIKAFETSRFKGGSVITFDLSQIELRGEGMLSGDPFFIEAYQNDKDIHTLNAISIFGPTTINDPHFGDGTHDDPRQPAKHCNFLMVYGGGAGRFQATLIKKANIFRSLEFCRDVVNKARRARPVMLEWQAQWVKDTLAKGYAILPFTGHSRYFMGSEANPEDERCEILNFPIQAMAAITMHRIIAYVLNKLPPLSRPNPPCLIYANRYDAAYFDTHPSFKSELPDIVEEAVRYVEQNEYWSWWQELTGNTIPLKYSIEEHN